MGAGNPATTAGRHRYAAGQSDNPQPRTVHHNCSPDQTMGFDAVATCQRRGASDPG